MLYQMLYSDMRCLCFFQLTHLYYYCYNLTIAFLAEIFKVTAPPEASLTF